MRTPYEVPEADFDEKVARLGPVDVLFTHIPPAVPDLTYDTVAPPIRDRQPGAARL